MKRKNVQIASVILVLVLINVALLIWVNSIPAKAQDTAPAWEYAALMYGDGDAFAFTGDNAITNEINKTLDALGDDQTNIISAMNIMGLNGWEYTTSENAGNGVSMLLFKRQK